MFDLSPEKILLLGVIALIVLGPDRLPKMARRAGQILGEARRMTGSLQTEMRDVLAEPRQALNDAVGEMGLPSLPSVPKMPSVRRTITDQLTGPINASFRDPQVAAPASASPSPSVEQGGLPPVPDDPSLN